MCDYSLESIASRAAKVGDDLLTTKFEGSLTRGLATENEPEVAVCLLPGTELAFASPVRADRPWSWLSNLFLGRNIGTTLARFRHINEGILHAHHDAVELVDGTIILVADLRCGQKVTVLQLPAGEARRESTEHVDLRPRIAPTRTEPQPSSAV